MKKILLREEQAKLIKEAIEHVTPKSIPLMVDDARKNNFDLLDDRVIEKLLDKRYNEIISYFSDDVTKVPVDKLYNTFSKLLTRCQKLEKPIKTQLENLCYNTIIDMFQIPEDMFTLTCTLQDNIDSKLNFHVKSTTKMDDDYEDYDSIVSEDDEVKKRKLINCLIAGGASALVDIAREHYIYELFKLNEELPHLYSKIMKINDLLMLSAKVEVTDKHHNQSGFEKVILSESGDELNKIESIGIVFPILLYETFKGIIELLASKGLPNREITEKVLDKADILQLDPTNMRIGSILWNNIFDGVDTKYIPYMFQHLMNVKPNMFEKLFNNIGFETKFSKKFIDDLKQRGEHSYEFDDFKNSLMKKKNDLSILNDNYLFESDVNNFDDKILNLIECKPSDITFEVGEVTDILPKIDDAKRDITEFQLYPVVNGIEYSPEDGINFRAEEVTVNGEPKYQLHIYIAENLRRNGIAAKLYEAFIKQGYPVCSLKKNRTATFYEENGGKREDDSAIENLWNKLKEKGINIKNIGDDDSIGVETY